MKKKKHLYSYTGAVTWFNFLVTRNWSAVTYAVSREQAKNNLKHRFKKEANMLPDRLIELRGTLVKI